MTHSGAFVNEGLSFSESGGTIVLNHLVKMLKIINFSLRTLSDFFIKMISLKFVTDNTFNSSTS